jgi:hypothetical protein
MVAAIPYSALIDHDVGLSHKRTFMDCYGTGQIIERNHGQKERRRE